MSTTAGRICLPFGKCPAPPTSDRILDAALASFASRGYEATSLDAVAKELELTKQSILYWFPSKDALLEAVIARSADDLSAALGDRAPAGGGGMGPRRGGRAVGVPLGRPPARAAGTAPRGGAPRPAGGHADDAGPRAAGATRLLVSGSGNGGGLDAPSDPRLLLLAIYSTVIGMVTEVEVLRALGEEPTARSLVRRRADVLQLLRSALLVDPGR